MSLSINANAATLAALTNVDNINSSLQQNVQRLSSGLQINSPGDNPSGYVQAHLMGYQITGIAQALNNTQDAMNMSKTADGGLGEISAALQQMRTLALSAANGALQSNLALQADQAQISSALSSIDRTANSTEWGNTQLLNGTAGVQATITDTTDVSGMFLGSTINGLPPANGPITIQLTSPAAQTTLNTNVTFTGAGAIVPGGAFSVNGVAFTADGSTQTVQDVVNEVNAQSAQTGVNASLVASGPNVTVQFQSTKYGTGYPVNLYDSNHMLDTATSPAPTTLGANAVASVTVPVTTATGPSTTTATFTGGQGPTGSGLELVDSSGNLLTLTPAGNNTTDLTAGAGAGVVNTGSLLFQTGQDATQNVSYAMPDAQTNQLGTGVVIGQSLATINITSQSGATQAVQIIDQAISQISTMRGNLGAFQTSLLQPNETSLGTATQNLSAAQSSIQDTDVAAEMTNYTKNQIIEQAGLSILAQANQDPQKILQLLQKA